MLPADNNLNKQQVRDVIQRAQENVEATRADEKREASTIKDLKAQILELARIVCVQRQSMEDLVETAPNRFVMMDPEPLSEPTLASFHIFRNQLKSLDPESFSTPEEHQAQFEEIQKSVFMLVRAERPWLLPPFGHEYWLDEEDDPYEGTMFQGDKEGEPEKSGKPDSPETQVEPKLEPPALPASD